MTLKHIEGIVRPAIAGEMQNENTVAVDVPGYRSARLLLRCHFCEFEVDDAITNQEQADKLCHIMNAHVKTVHPEQVNKQ